MKIYPAFYVFLAVSVLGAGLFFPEGRDLLPNSLAEFFFVQNYREGLWGHTWSLAVEEHFYLLLALVAIVVMPRVRLSPRLVLGSIGLIAMACLAMRVATAAASGYSWQALYAPTHLRIDSLLIGVALAYLSSTTSRDRMLTVATTYFWWLAAAGLALISPVFLFERWDPLMYTVGMTFLALGFGLILLVTLTIEDRRAPRPIAYLGQFSYTTYLWRLADDDRGCRAPPGVVEVGHPGPRPGVCLRCRDHRRPGRRDTPLCARVTGCSHPAARCRAASMVEPRRRPVKRFRPADPVVDGESVRMTVADVVVLAR